MAALVVVIVGGALVLCAALGTLGVRVASRKKAPSSAEAPLIPVTRGLKVASETVDPAIRAKVDTGDGLILDIPPGGLGEQKKLTVHRARPALPSFQVASLTGGPAAQPTFLIAWDVDIGAQTTAFPKPVDVRIPLAKTDAGSQDVMPLLSMDGHTWQRPHYEIVGGEIRFSTRHFSIIVVLGVPAIMVGSAYLVYTKGGDELPELLDADAPFVALPDMEASPFDIRWSRRLAGVDPATGLKDAAGYRRRLEEIYAMYGEACRGGGAPVCRTEIIEARKQFLIPDAVRDIETALLDAKRYLDSRGFQEPWFSLPVFVVPSVAGAEAVEVNPVFFRRYLKVGAVSEGGRDSRYRNALHELFHAYQECYTWVKWNNAVPFMEASALLLDREASGHFRTAHGVDLLGSENNADLMHLQRGIDGDVDIEELTAGTSDETKAIRLGYAMSWFLEYARDYHYAGDKARFHPSLLDYWYSTYTSSNSKAYAWAAGGTEASLRKAWLTFARDHALPGMPDANKWGIRYFPEAAASLFSSAPRYTVNSWSETTTLEGESFPNLSITFVRLVRQSIKPDTVVLKVPREWAKAAPEPGRHVLVGVPGSSGTLAVKSIADLEAYPQSISDSSFAALAPTIRHLFVVDTGQSGRRWLGSLPSAELFVLQSPRDVRCSAGTNGAHCSWKPPELRPVLDKYLAYLKGTNVRVAVVDNDDDEVDVPSAKLQGATELDIVSAVIAGKDKEGNSLYVESARGLVAAANVSVRYRSVPDAWRDMTGSHAKEGTKSLPYGDLNTVAHHISSQTTPPVMGAADVRVYVTSSAKLVAELQGSCQWKDTNGAWSPPSCPVGPAATQTTLAGLPAWKTLYTSNERGLTVRFVNYWVQAATGSYVLVSVSISPLGDMPGMSCDVASTIDHFQRLADALLRELLITSG